MKALLLILALTILSGCQAMEEAHQRQMETLCTYDGGYSKGVEHAEGEEGSQATQTLAYCPAGTKAQALKGYNDGYQDSKPQQDNSIFGQVMKHIDKRTSSYICSIDVFTNTFEAKGVSKADALHNTKQECIRRRNGDNFFCKKESDYSCKRLY